MFYGLGMVCAKGKVRNRIDVLPRCNVRAKPKRNRKGEGMGEVGMNNEWANAKMREGYLREKCAGEVEEYMHLTTCVGPNLKTQYMLCIGQLEHRVFQLKTDIARWQRRFTLRQQSLNRGETPDLVRIEAQLDEEFKEYLRKVKEHLEAMKAAAQHASMARLSEKETAAIRLNYLKAAKRLHPDINPDLPESARELWHKIHDAYANGDWKELEFLVGMVDDVVSGAVETPEGEDALEALKKSIARLEKRLAELQERRIDLEKQEPFIWRKFLEDSEAVAMRQAVLDKKIAELEEVVLEYESLWNAKEVA